MIIFKGNERFAYRDPACCFEDGICHLFFTVSEKDDGYMYNRIAHSQSSDLKNWTIPEFITPKDTELNFSSPGNIIRHNGEFLICICSYPLTKPFAEEWIAHDTARLYLIRTKDFKSYSEPELINPKGNTLPDDLGRMIDPYILEKNDGYYLFFKQNGVSLSRSQDLKNWEFLGSTDGGENVCVLEHNGEYLLIHSPENGIAIAKSNDLENWSDYLYTTLLQDEWDWAAGRLTAAFAAKLPEGSAYKYIMFFHGSKDVFPETHGDATLAAAFTDDFESFVYELN